MPPFAPWLACFAVLPACAGRGAHEAVAQVAAIHDPTTAGQLEPVRWSMLEVATPAGVEFAMLRVQPDPGVHYHMQTVVGR